MRKLGAEVVMRRLLMALVFSFSLGCMGAVNGLTGLDLDMQLGEDAVHPTDFAVQPIAGEKVMSMGMTADADNLNLPENVDIDVSQLDRVRMDMISYNVTDLDGATSKALEELKAAGYQEQTSDDPTVHIYTSGVTVFVLAATDEGSDKTLNLIRLEPRADEAGGATEAAE